MWRTGPNSAKFLPCRMKGVCVGGNGTRGELNNLGYCLDFHTGPLCEVREIPAADRSSCLLLWGVPHMRVESRWDSTGVCTLGVKLTLCLRLGSSCTDDSEA